MGVEGRVLSFRAQEFGFCSVEVKDVGLKVLWRFKVSQTPGFDLFNRAMLIHCSRSGQHAGPIGFSLEYVCAYSLQKKNSVGLGLLVYGVDFRIRRSGALFKWTLVWGLWLDVGFRSQGAAFYGEFFGQEY